MKIGYKNIILILLLFLGGHNLSAQDDTWTPKTKEILKQRKTRLSYMYEFIALSIVKKQLNKKFSRQSQKGLDNIHSHKDENYFQDNQYIVSLSKVPPFIAESPFLKNILENHQYILLTSSETQNDLEDNEVYITPEQLQFYTNAFDGLLIHLEKDIDELNMVVIENEMNLKDDERLNRLMAISEESDQKRKYASMLSRRSTITILSRINTDKESQIQNSEINYEN